MHETMNFRSLFVFLVFIGLRWVLARGEKTEYSVFIPLLFREALRGNMIWVGRCQVLTLSDLYSSAVSAMPADQVSEIPQQVVGLVMCQCRYRVHDLLPLCLVSRWFCHHAHRHLYRTLAISDHISSYIAPNFPKLKLKKSNEAFYYSIRTQFISRWIC